MAQGPWEDFKTPSAPTDGPWSDFKPMVSATAPQPAPSASDDRTATEVMQDQAAHVLQGIPQAITGIPGMAARLGRIVATGDASDALNLVKDVLHPLVTTARGTGALVAPNTVQAPTRQEFEQAAEAAGANLGATELGNVAGPALDAAKAGAKAVLPSSEYFQNRANVNTARSLKPTGLESKAIAQRIAPELSARSTGESVPPGVTDPAIAQIFQKEGRIPIRGGSGTIDTQIEQGLQKATDRLRQVEDRVISDPRPEAQIETAPIIDQIDTAIQKLKVRGTDVSGHPDAINALQKLRDDIRGLPKYADADQVIQLRRQYDQAIQEAGGYKEAGTAADRVALKAKKGVADLLRASINNLDPELKIANHDYSLFRDANEIVRRRQLGEVGTGERLPGGSAILDDILATWAGKAIGGPVGGVVGEAVNLGRQTRGFASTKAALQQYLADKLRPETAPSAGLLTEGSPQLEGVPDQSGVRGIPAQPAVSGTPRMLTSGARQMPAAPDTSFVRATNAQPAIRLPKGLLAPPKNAIITPPPADASRLRVIDAEKQIAVDPNTGIIHTFYVVQR